MRFDDSNILGPNVSIKKRKKGKEVYFQYFYLFVIIIFFFFQVRFIPGIHVQHKSMKQLFQIRKKVTEESYHSGALEYYINSALKNKLNKMNA